MHRRTSRALGALFAALVVIGCDRAGEPIGSTDETAADAAAEANTEANAEADMETSEVGAGSVQAFGQAHGGKRAYTTEFHLDRCDFQTEGRNPYFILEPGYTLKLAGESDGENVELRITVLDETIEVGGVETRIVEERETADGELTEVSRNYFAFCPENGSVFYFGEDVDIYEDGEIVSHEGAWRHGVDGARAGLIMPGLPLLGARFFQEIAPEVALDRAIVVALDAEVRTPAGTFRDALATLETTPLEPSARELKFYAVDVGLVRDADLRLVSHGFSAATARR